MKALNIELMLSEYFSLNSIDLWSPEHPLIPVKIVATPVKIIMCSAETRNTQSRAETGGMRVGRRHREWEDSQWEWIAVSRGGNEMEAVMWRKENLSSVSSTCKLSGFKTPFRGF
ncbi:hypothetical protein ILYODFUR_028771, partial [Ilyodon furcidens]